MAKLQRLAHSQPARSGTSRIKSCHDKSCDRILSVNRTLSPALSTGLAIILLPGFAHADIVIPALTDGTYRSAEQSAFSAAELGLSLSRAPLPDPASFGLQSDPTSKADLRYVSWDDDVAWITGIGTLLYNDSDHDGYHSGFSLTIDADTSMNIMDVYLSVDLQSYSGVQERLHTSNNFSLYGRTLTDEYQIDIDLLQNYPTDEYDLTIELHDTYDHRVLDRVSAGDFSNLSALPLESEDLDYVYNPGPVPHSYPPANDDYYVENYAGSTGLLTTLCLSLSLWVRRKKRAGCR